MNTQMLSRPEKAGEPSMAPTFTSPPADVKRIARSIANRRRAHSVMSPARIRLYILVFDESISPKA